MPSQIIQAAITEAISTGFGVRLDCHEVDLNISYPKYAAHYTSPIAIALAHRLGQDALIIAKAIAEICTKTCTKISSENPEIVSRWQIQAIGKGWLNIQFTELYLGEILLLLEELQIIRIEDINGIWQKQSLNANPKIIEANYPYARCCALIRLAYREGLLPLTAEIMPQNIYIGVEPVEISLLMQNLAIADYLQLAQEKGIVSNNKKVQEKRDKLARSLAELFLQFYDQCRIFGVSHNIAISRLLLIRSTQKMLLALAPSNVQYLHYL
nr:DALR anticodon-binding domain-containing protein [Pseudanabaena sp. FACHB-1998]